MDCGEVLGKVWVLGFGVCCIWVSCAESRTFQHQSEPVCLSVNFFVTRSKVAVVGWQAHLSPASACLQITHHVCCILTTKEGLWKRLVVYE